MKEENILTLGRMGAGLVLVGLYAFTGANGIILVMSAFLLGMPIEYFIKAKE